MGVFILFFFACGLLGWFFMGMLMKHLERRRLEAAGGTDKALAEAMAGLSVCPACGERCENLEECFANMEARAEEKVNGPRCMKCGELMRNTNDPEMKYCDACRGFGAVTLMAGDSSHCPVTDMVSVNLEGGKKVEMTAEVYRSMTRPLTPHVTIVDVSEMTAKEAIEAVAVERKRREPAPIFFPICHSDVRRD